MLMLGASKIVPDQTEASADLSDALAAESEAETSVAIDTSMEQEAY